MRGKRVSLDPKKADVVIVAARYAPQDGRLTLAQGYQRRGPVWSDIRLFDRKQILDMLQANRRVVAGRPKDLAMDFELFGRLRRVGQEGAERIVLDSEADASRGDNLGVPLF